MTFRPRAWRIVNAILATLLVAGLAGICRSHAEDRGNPPLTPQQFNLLNRLTWGASTSSARKNEIRLGPLSVIIRMIVTGSSVQKT